MRIPFRHRHLWRALEVLAWTAFFAFALFFLASRYWLLPNIERYREDFVAAVTRATGLQVKIGTLNADWQGLRLRLSVTDVRVYDGDGREALVLPLVESVVAWRSLFVRDLRLHSSLIDAPKLSVRREAGGDLYIAGIRIAGDQGDGKVADWILSQDQITVRGAEIEWLDESRKAPPLRLSDLNFRLENDGDEHLVGLNARPPRELGPIVELRARLEGGSVRQAAQWSGRIYAEFGYTDLAAWRPWFDYPLDVRRGEGALRIWGSLAGGRFSQATADVALSNVTARLGRDLPLLEMSSVRGRVYGRQTERGYDFGVRSLSMTRPNAPPMNGTSFRAIWEPASANAPAQRGSVTANLVELGPLAHLAEYLPFPADLRALLAELGPQGNLLDAKFDWTGELPDQATYTAKTRFAGLTMKAWRSIPGFANLSGSVEANEKKGVLYLASRKSELDLPKVFPEPRIALDALSGEVNWERSTSGGVDVRVANLNYANADLAGNASGTFGRRADGQNTIDLTAQLSRADGKATARYLPLSSVMGARTRDWVANAVLAGEASDARLRLRGNLNDFPFLDPAKGEFQVTAKVSGAILDYAAGWPRIEEIDARLLFERDRIEITGDSGSILGARIANVKVSLPSMLDPSPHLIVEGGAEGPTAIFLDYIRESPVRRMIGGFTDSLGSLGRGKLRLRLDLALHEIDKTKVAGEYQFAGNTVTFDARLPPIQRVGGRVAFTESSMTVGDVRGQLFGGEVRVSGGSRPETGVVISAEGRATLEGLRAVFDHPWRKRLSGATRYTAVITAKDGRAQLALDSTLEGIASAMPAPLSKAAPEVLPLRIEVFPGDGRDRISIALGPPTGRIVAAEILRAAQTGPGVAPGTMQVQRTLVTLNPVSGETPRIPERRGTTIRGALPALDFDRWLPLVAESGAATGAPGSGDGAGYDVRIGVLDALGKRMRSVVLQGAADASGWSASVSTSEFAGDVVYRTEGNGRLVGRFTRFTLPEDSPSMRPPGQDPVANTPLKDLPAVDLVVDSFTHRGRKLGRVEVLARHEGRDWRIDKATVTNPDAALSATGLWKQADASRTALGFKLDVSDVGQFMDRVGYPDHLKGGRATLEGSLNWNGDPLNLDYATLGGQLKLQADDGQFLEIEPGIGKLVSLMSLQMLPRRISMDFRDVFSKGFQFDSITSSLAIERGVMAVKGFHMRGPAADVTMTGQVDLALETQSLNVKVIPQLGDTASTVVGLVHPIAGVATLIAGRLMKNPLGKAFAFDYAISGTWTDPKVEKLQPSVLLNVPADPGSPGNRDIYERKAN